jgi:DNA polymerase-3 subunit delta'
MSFSSVIGHEHPIRILRRAIHAERVSHAYLFVGPASVGKTLVAHEFAKVLNCQGPPLLQDAETLDPCDQCQACVNITRDAFPDVHLVQPLSKLQSASDEDSRDVVFEGTMITTEQIADVVREANLKATHGRRKVFIITSAEAMNPASANRLLKTLEEPPGQTTLILTTQNLAGLLPTIISRCQMVTFRPAPLVAAEEALRARHPEVDPGTLRSLAALSGGRIGWAERLLLHPQVLSLRADLLGLAASLNGRDWFEGMAVGEKLIGIAEDWWLATEDEDFAERALKASRDRVLRTRMNDVLDVLLSWFRDLLLIASEGSPGLVVNGDRLPAIQASAAGRNPARLRRACEDIQEIRRQLRGNANLRLACEVLAMKLIGALK